MDRAGVSDQFRKIIIRHKLIGYNLNVMRQSACLVISPITADNFAAPFNCTPVVIVGWDRSPFVYCLVHRDSTDDLHLLQISSGVADQGSTFVMHTLCPLLLHSFKM